MDALSPRKIEGEGTAEHAWQAAEWLAQAPLASLDDLLPAQCRLLVVSPHPDDEVLGCGGLIHDALAAGRRVLVVTLTEGELAYPEDRYWQPERLARARRRELRQALDLIGARGDSLVHLALGDGRLAQRRACIGRALHGLCEPGDVLFSTWSQDGHPDHEAAAGASAEVAAALGLVHYEYPIWGWHWAQPQGRPFGGAVHRYALGPASRERKAAALRCFATQTGEALPVVANPVLPPSVLARFHRPFEVFLRA